MLATHWSEQAGGSETLKAEVFLWAILAAVEVGLGGSAACSLTPRPGVSCLGKGSLGQALF